MDALQWMEINRAFQFSIKLAVRTLSATVRASQCAVLECAVCVHRNIKSGAAAAERKSLIARAQEFTMWPPRRASPPRFPPPDHLAARYWPIFLNKQDEFSHETRGRIASVCVKFSRLEILMRRATAIKNEWRRTVHTLPTETERRGTAPLCAAVRRRLPAHLHAEGRLRRDVDYLTSVSPAPSPHPRAGK